MNITVTVAPGSTNHGQEGLLCVPPVWHDYIVFYFANYFAHAMTVVTHPGQSPWEIAILVISALLFPASGASRAIDAILRHAAFKRNVLQRAADAGALCMVAHKHSESRPTESKLPWWKPYNPMEVPPGTAVHGKYPKGCTLVYVPMGAPIHFRESDDTSVDTKQAISCSYNIPKLVFSLLQAIWAIVTLYRAHGDQVEQYGYAAFGLTVVPYAFMSVLNTIANILNPDYPAVYMVRTPQMELREARGGVFAGEISVQLSDEAVEGRYFRDTSSWLPLGFWASLVQIGIVGGLSRFRPQRSTSMQRGFTMSWLVLGIFFAFSADSPMILRAEYWRERTFCLSLYNVALLSVQLCIPGIAALGGFVVVGMMIRDYGHRQETLDVSGIRSEEQQPCIARAEPGPWVDMHA
ncbi:hypothetical protein CONLIGDRAFT_666471 [Coniochaeta ligniaria NRRL 30616]|uniref:Uncharacterized protein n=1 Tax=Coniochaeta ligniaria NRRL 30616 TaxID=1408157 RepID=A0A1J7IZC5_9PEZI|nr:hypothetical protein CONLIGDRAFT_666471 [Coniochaeta ligniaria NRRL 30616]